MIPNTDNKINLLQQNFFVVVDPLPQLIMVKAYTGETAHYFTQADSHALANIQQINMGNRVILQKNITMDL